MRCPGSWQTGLLPEQYVPGAPPLPNGRDPRFARCPVCARILRVSSRVGQVARHEFYRGDSRLWLKGAKEVLRYRELDELD